MSFEEEGKLKRSLSLVDVIALGVNAVIGQGIFLQPGNVAALMGPASLVALGCAGFLAFLIALCFAEVGSRFRTTGGAYAYARAAFGGFVGYEVGWMLCVVCVVSWAALANGFTLVLAYFIPAAGVGVTQKVVAVSLMTVMVLINIKGAKLGGMLSTVCSVAKLIPILLFVVLGLGAIKGAHFQPFAPMGYDGLAEGILLLLYAFVGFESAVVPAGEMEEPQKAVPFSLISVMCLVCLVYALVFVVCIGVYPDLAGSKNPVSEAAQLLMGSTGAGFIAAGIVVSVLGINAAQALVGPRKIFAMAERGDLPAPLARVHEKSGVPRNAIVATYLVAAVLTVSGTFKELALLGVVARFAQYIPTCLALLVFRARDRKAGRAPHGFRVPFAEVVVVLTLVLIGWLIMETDPHKLVWGLLAMAAGVPFYFLRSHDGDEPEEVD